MRYSEDIETRLTGRHKRCIKICGNLRDRKILNIGCFNGWFEKFAVENGCTEVVGIDIDENNLLNAKAQVKDKRAKFLKASALDLSRFETNYFNIVTMFDVIEHLPKNMEEKCLLEIKRVLKKRGTLVISTPYNSFFSNVLDPAWYLGHRHYSKDNIEKILSKVGFKVEKIDYGGGFYELFSMILFYVFKWIFRKEIPFKKKVDYLRDKEYQEEDGSKLATLFVKAVKL